jgi:methanogenic corrinoid protein MtbC1
VPLLQAIARHDPEALRGALAHAQLSMGLAPFVTELVAPLAAEVGQAWAQGRFEIFEEHLFTEVVTGVLRQAIASLARPASPSGPKVLLTTLPPEMHGLGLLMVEALLWMEGCTCVSLGTQTPVGDVARAARAHGAQVVALSFSDVHKGQRVRASLAELRALLPASVAIWVGGSCQALQRGNLPGITVLQGLPALRASAAQWRQPPA